LRDDGKYECECGIVATKHEIRVSKKSLERVHCVNPFDIEFADFWNPLEHELFTKKGMAKIRCPFAIELDQGNLILNDGYKWRTLYEIERIQIMSIDEDGWAILWYWYDSRKRLKW
jgi:hypothetical protein